MSCTIALPLGKTVVVVADAGDQRWHCSRQCPFLNSEELTPNDEMTKSHVEVSCTLQDREVFPRVLDIASKRYKYTPFRTPFCISQDPEVAKHPDVLENVRHHFNNTGSHGKPVRELVR